MKEIRLTNGHVAIVDEEDFEKFGHQVWHVTGREPYMYARRAYRPERGTWAHLLLHRQIANAPPGAQVRFRNGNTLDCRKANLRVIEC